MPTAKVILDTRRKSKKGYPLKLYIAHKDDSRTIALNVWCEKEQFDPSKIKVKGIDNHVYQSNVIKDKLTKAKMYMVENNCKDLTCQELKERIEDVFKGKRESAMYLSEWVSIIQSRLRANQQFKTALVYQNSLDAFKRFHKRSIKITSMDVTFLENFKAKCNEGKLSNNTISVYMRTMRAIVNKARKESELTGVPKSFRPFEDVTIPTGKSKKVALSLKQLRKIKDAKFIPGTPLWHHRNYFLFMFYCRGMNFKDLAFATTDNIQGKYLVYEREKTGIEFRILLLPQMKEILSFYNERKRFLFPIMKETTKLNTEEALKEKDQALHVHNNYLQKIEKTLKIKVNMTSYVARHTYVAIGRDKGYNPKELSEGLGHSDSLITEKHYFPNANQSFIDSMNKVIVKL